MKFLLLPSLLLIVTVYFAFSAPEATTSLRRPSPTLASLPPPAATGPLRILLVDDDISDNNHYPDDKRLSPSDRVFRKLVADAVGGDASAWAVESAARLVVDSARLSEVFAVEVYPSPGPASGLTKHPPDT